MCKRLVNVCGSSQGGQIGQTEWHFVGVSCVYGGCECVTGGDEVMSVGLVVVLVAKWNRFKQSGISGVSAVHAVCVNSNQW